MILTVTPNPALDRTLEVRGFAAGGTYKAELRAVRPAGKGLNVSRCLSDLGAKSCATAILGRGAARRFASSLKEQNIAHAFVESDCEVRQSTTVIDPRATSSGERNRPDRAASSGQRSRPDRAASSEQRSRPDRAASSGQRSRPDRAGNETHVRERGGPVAPAELDALVELVKDRVSPGDWAAICGSLPEGMDASGLARVLAAAKSRGARVALDSSGEGLRAAMLAGTMLAGVDLLKPNATELSELAGREVGDIADAVEAAREVHRRLGAGLLVTLGERGALLVAEGVSLHGNCEPEGFTSAVGAGDAALAGYLWAESAGRPPGECLSAAVAAGAASLAEPVAGKLDRRRFQRLLERVELTEATPNA